ncbi:hypothetical protein JKP88DRAFT_329071 [Tribonema minus]|uniref:DUF1279 domain-containing protein n=1 Tax=Tribonema minus TaxID=303371 RepID=A0A836CBX4_9STRA|nr:hypothetical protein JKP88DRAFT_329071 [Tribonema minus]
MLTGARQLSKAHLPAMRTVIRSTLLSAARRHPAFGLCPCGAQIQKLQHSAKSKHERGWEPRRRSSHTYPIAGYEPMAREDDRTPESSTASTTKDKKWSLQYTMGRFKHIMKEYGPVAATLHGSVFLTTLGGMYAALEKGLDINALLAQLPFIDGAALGSGGAGGQLAVAYGATLMTGPARTILTVVATPKVAHVWHAYIKSRPAPLIKPKKDSARKQES